MDKVESAVNKATLLLEREVIKKAPKGEIAQSIASKVDGVTGTVYTVHRLAPYIEFGTGIFADPSSGHPSRKDVPWVYVEGQYNEPGSKRIYTEAEADRTVASMRADGIPAVKTYGSEPKPFLRPALDENKQEIVEILGESLIND
jgi:hypothetical protein